MVSSLKWSKIRNQFVKWSCRFLRFNTYACVMWLRKLKKLLVACKCILQRKRQYATMQQHPFFSNRPPCGLGSPGCCSLHLSNIERGGLDVEDIHPNTQNHIASHQAWWTSLPAHVDNLATPNISCFCPAGPLHSTHQLVANHPAFWSRPRANLKLRFVRQNTR